MQRIYIRTHICITWICWRDSISLVLFHLKQLQLQFTLLTTSPLLITGKKHEFRRRCWTRLASHNFFFAYKSSLPTEQSHFPPLHRAVHLYGQGHQLLRSVDNGTITAVKFHKMCLKVGSNDITSFHISILVLLLVTLTPSALSA